MSKIDASPDNSTENPLLDDPNILWYVQPPGGGPQYGPVTGLVVRAWIAERRITSRMLVWQKGWPGWLEAQKVFPELRAGGVTPPRIPTNATTVSDSVSQGEAAKRGCKDSKALGNRLEKKARSRQKRVIVLALTAVILILGAILIMLLGTR